ncbi:hypothetical protein [Neisseria viridiae]|uniref:hypothetical protein n=1 Tax=Neisseria viridiae TaxID=2830648 RepID=UPI00265845C3|nr:hypothetical protein [Neisseria viridiae]
MPSETLSDRFRRHFHTPPCRFSGRFLLNAKYPVIPAPSPPVQTGMKTCPRHSRESGNPGSLSFSHF